MTASVAQREPDPYLAQVYRFGLLEDFDHLYRYSALYGPRRGQGRQQHSSRATRTSCPGRPTAVEHRAPEDDLRAPYDRRTAAPLTKLHALTIMAGEHQTHDYYMTIGPMFADPVARQLYAEIASIEEQHVTQYESIIDPNETWLEKWLLHEATEVYNYWSCVEYETNPRIKADLGALPRLRARPRCTSSWSCSRQIERPRRRRGAARARCPSRSSTRATASSCARRCAREVDSARGRDGVRRPRRGDRRRSRAYREQLNSDGSPSETVAAGYMWQPGTELTDPAEAGPTTDRPSRRGGPRESTGSSARSAEPDRDHDRAAIAPTRWSRPRASLADSGGERRPSPVRTRIAHRRRVSAKRHRRARSWARQGHGGSAARRSADASDGQAGRAPGLRARRRAAVRGVAVQAPSVRLFDGGPAPRTCSHPDEEYEHAELLGTPSRSSAATRPLLTPGGQSRHEIDRAGSRRCSAIPAPTVAGARGASSWPSLPTTSAGRRWRARAPGRPRRAREHVRRGHRARARPPAQGPGLDRGRPRTHGGGHEQCRDDRGRGR